MPKQIKLTQVKAARRAAWQGQKVSDIAKSLSLNYGQTWSAVRGATWSTLTDPPPIPDNYLKSGKKPRPLSICANPNCAKLADGAKGYCQACYTYQHRHGEMRPHNPRCGRPRKPEDVRYLRRLHARHLAGESIEAIAKEIGISGQTLGRHFRSARLPTRKPNMVLTPDLVQQFRALHYSDNYSIAKIARTFNINYQTVYGAVTRRTWRHKIGGPLPADDDGDEKTACTRCGVLTAHPLQLCRFCRDEHE